MSAATAAEPKPMPTEDKQKPKPPRDPAREVVETIVFVVVLVLLLKLFVTEAFVIPTGSMAETLYGYQKIVTCPKCGDEFPVNSHDEVEGRDGRVLPLYGYTCPNCRYMGRIQDLNPVPGNHTGDRVLVLKPLYHIRDPIRGEVVVFKFPEKPQEKWTAQNYIKRVMGFGGETVAIYRGDLFVTRGLAYPADAVDDRGQPLYPRPKDPLDLWKPEFMYSRPNPLATDLFEASLAAGFKGLEGVFEVVRKGEDQVLADLRLVWDNDRQPTDLGKAGVPPRWYPEAGPQPNAPAAWNGDDKFQPKVFRHPAGGWDWLRYRHLAMPWKTTPPNDLDPTPPTDPTVLANQAPIPVDNFLAYNAGRSIDTGPGGVRRLEVRHQGGDDARWVGDLALQGKATLTPGAEVALELSKGVDRFRATFAEGKVTLSRFRTAVADGKITLVPVVLGEESVAPTRPCKVAAGKEHTLRFANIDCRLWVWVDGRRVDFGPEGDYRPPTPEDEAKFVDTEEVGGKEVPRPAPGAQPDGSTRVNDVLAPAGVGATGDVTVRSLVLHRDVYYTRRGTEGRAEFLYVQPDHYLCLGDNSAQSSDSRTWGAVPGRLMLGKAVFVFWPAPRIGFIK
jgi:signal peptidase I